MVRTLISRTLTFVFILLVTGCMGMTFSTKNPLPYEDVEYHRLDVGTSTRDDVVSLLGQPALKLDDGTLWIYARTRPEKTDYMGGYRHDYQALLIELRDGVVSYKASQHVNEVFKPACWGKHFGLCLKPEWDFPAGGSKPGRLSRVFSSVISYRDDDITAKRFQSDEGQCAIYVYSVYKIFGSITPPLVSVGTVKDEPVPTSGYLHLQSQPSRLAVYAGDNSLSFDCEAGSLHVFELYRPQFADDADIRIESIPFDEGTEAIRKRQLLVTW